MKNRVYNLQNRLINFASNTIKFVTTFPEIYKPDILAIN